MTRKEFGVRSSVTNRRSLLQCRWDPRGWQVSRFAREQLTWIRVVDHPNTPFHYHRQTFIMLRDRHLHRWWCVADHAYHKSVPHIVRLFSTITRMHQQWQEWKVDKNTSRSSTEAPSVSQLCFNSIIKLRMIGQCGLPSLWINRPGFGQRYQSLLNLRFDFLESRASEHVVCPSDRCNDRDR